MAVTHQPWHTGYVVAKTGVVAGSNVLERFVPHAQQKRPAPIAKTASQQPPQSTGCSPLPEARSTRTRSSSSDPNELTYLCSPISHQPHPGYCRESTQAWAISTSIDRSPVTADVQWCFKPSLCSCFSWAPSSSVTAACSLCRQREGHRDLRRFADCGAGSEDNLAVYELRLDLVSRCKVTGEQRVCEWVFNQLLNRALQRPRAVHWIKADLR